MASLTTDSEKSAGSPRHSRQRPSTQGVRACEFWSAGWRLQSISFFTADCTDNQPPRVHTDLLQSRSDKTSRRQRGTARAALGVSTQLFGLKGAAGAPPQPTRLRVAHSASPGLRPAPPSAVKEFYSLHFLLPIVLDSRQFSLPASASS